MSCPHGNGFGVYVKKRYRVDMKCAVKWRFCVNTAKPIMDYVKSKLEKYLPPIQFFGELQ